MPAPHDSHTHIAGIECAEKHFHAPEMPLEVLSPSNDIAGTWGPFSTPPTSAKCSYTMTLHCATNPIQQEAQKVPGLAKVCQCTATTTQYFAS